VNKKSKKLLQLWLVMSTCIKPIRFLGLYFNSFRYQNGSFYSYITMIESKIRPNSCNNSKEITKTKTKRNEFSIQSKKRIVFETEKAKRWHLASKSCLFALKNTLKWSWKGKSYHSKAEKGCFMDLNFQKQLCNWYFLSNRIKLFVLLPKISFRFDIETKSNHNFMFRYDIETTKRWILFRLLCTRKKNNTTTFNISDNSG
jgi:hypothetical protein